MLRCSFTENPLIDPTEPVTVTAVCPRSVLPATCSSWPGPGPSCRARDTPAGLGHQSLGQAPASHQPPAPCSQARVPGQRVLRAPSFRRSLARLPPQERPALSPACPSPTLDSPPALCARLDPQDRAPSARAPGDRPVALSRGDLEARRLRGERAGDPLQRLRPQLLGGPHTHPPQLPGR